MREAEGEPVAGDWEGRHEGGTAGEPAVHRPVAELRKLVLLFSSWTEGFDNPPLTCTNL